MTAMQIAALKRVNPGSTIYLLDKNGGQAKKVARELAAKGFRKAFVVAGGFDGRNGWTSSKLQVKPSSSVKFAEVLPGLGRLGTIVTNRPARKALPSP